MVQKQTVLLQKKLMPPGRSNIMTMIIVIMLMPQNTTVTVGLTVLCSTDILPEAINSTC